MAPGGLNADRSGYLGNLQLPPKAEMIFGSPESCLCPATGHGREQIASSAIERETRSGSVL
jgi:hypothetical protein